MGVSEEEGRGGAFLVAGTLGSPGGIKRVLQDWTGGWCHLSAR